MKKTIVSIKKDDGNKRLYELPEGFTIDPGTKVKMATAYGETTGTVAKAPFEVDAGLLGDIIETPLKRVTAILTETRIDWADDDTGDTEEEKTEE